GIRKGRGDFKERYPLFGSGFPIGASSIPVGTRLWNQSLVCYTFVQQTAAAWGSSALLSSQQGAPAGQQKRQRKADSLCLKAQVASLLLSAEQRYIKPRRSGLSYVWYSPITFLGAFPSDWSRFSGGSIFG